MTEEALTVGQLYRKAKNALAREFRGLVWVTGEIKSIREHRGSWYISLVEPGEFANGSDVSVDVACWSKRRMIIQSQLADAGISLAAGMEVRVQGNVSLGKFGKVVIELAQLDTEALLGKQEAEKRRLYEALRREGLLEKNRQLRLPRVPLRVGLVTSEGSEGFNDFMGQLERSGYAFAVSLVHSPVQGPTAPNLLARAIASFAIDEVDVIAVVRGGGGELDAFDKEPVAQAISNATAPVFTGIGHTGDRSVADDVAFRPLITPTECGHALVGVVDAYLDTVNGLVVEMQRLSSHAMARESDRIRNSGKHLTRSVTTCMERASVSLNREAERARRCADRDLALASANLDGRTKDLLRASTTLPSGAADDLAALARSLVNASTRAKDRMEQAAKVRRAHLSLLDPKKQLQRGYTLTRTPAGEIVRDIADVKAGGTLVTTFASGQATSTVTKVESEGNQ